MLNEEELEGVIAHELSHIKHYDILIGTIAAVFSGAIAMIANMMQFGAMFGNNSDRQNSNPIMMIAMAILLPIAASIIQMTVSRSREFMADEGAARLTGNPAGLQSALSKLENYARSGHQIHNATEQTAHMFIINPFSGLKSNIANLFRTHPTTEDRIARLEELKAELKRR
jgi:heat shock protein HtpX